MKLIEKIPSLTAYLLVAISVLLVSLIYIGGNSETLFAAGEELLVPEYTDSLLIWSYVLFAFTLLITLGIIVYSFISGLIHNTSSTLRRMIPFALFGAIFFIAWIIGSPDKIEILGYEGTENVGFWSQITDMFIYSTYTLFFFLVIAIIGAKVYSSLR